LTVKVIVYGDHVAYEMKTDVYIHR